MFTIVYFNLNACVPWFLLVESYSTELTRGNGSRPDDAVPFLLDALYLSAHENLVATPKNTDTDAAGCGDNHVPHGSPSKKMRCCWCFIIVNILKYFILAYICTIPAPLTLAADSSAFHSPMTKFMFGTCCGFAALGNSNLRYSQPAWNPERLLLQVRSWLTMKLPKYEIKLLICSHATTPCGGW